MNRLKNIIALSFVLVGLLFGREIFAQSTFEDKSATFPLPMEAPPTLKTTRSNRYLRTAPMPPEMTTGVDDQSNHEQKPRRQITMVSAPIPVPKPAPIPQLAPQSAGQPTVPMQSIPTMAVGQALSLDEVRMESTMANPALQQLARLAAAKRGEWVQAGLKENPMIGYAADEMYKNNSGKHGVELSQTLIRKYKLSARQAAASKDVLVAQARYETQCRKVINDAMLVAYRTAVYEQKCRLLQTLSRNTQVSLQSGRALLDAKEISRADYLELKIQAERTRIALQDAMIAYHASSKELALLLGRSPEMMLSITDVVDSLPAELNEAACLAELEAYSPEVQEAYRKVEAARAVLRRESAEAGIDIDANATVLYNTESKDTEVSIGVAVPLKIFNRNQGNIRRAQSELVAAQRNVDRVRLLLGTKLQRTLADYQSARNRVLAYEQNLLKEAQESFELALNAYKHGEYSSIELLNVQRTLIDVKVEHLDSIAAFWETQTLIQGSLLTGGLETE